MNSITKEHSSITLKNVSLAYELHYDRTTDLKEYLINLITRRKYTHKAKDYHNALSEINLEIGEGERVGIIGLNGAGKSTLLKVISGILKPTSGEVTVNGAVQPLIEIGAGFNPDFTGRENIYLNSYMLGYTKAQVTKYEEEVIKFADIGPFIDTPIKYYSSGMSVRLAFSIATIVNPEILVFDEMLSAGDAVFIEKAKKRVNELITKAKIMVLVSHDLELVRSLCTRCVVIKNGRVLFDGTSEEGIKFYLSSVATS